MKRFVAGLLAAALALLPGCASGDFVTATSAAVPTATATAAPTEAPAASAAASPAPTAQPVDESWTPNGPVTLIVAYKEGSSTDVGARLLAGAASEQLGQPITVKNIPANSGMTAWETLAGAAPDGYTLGFINMPNVFTAIENGGGFTMQSFTPICSHVVETSVIVVAEDSPYRTLDDLVAANRAASASGELLRAATNGVQASNDIGAALLAYASGGWQFRHVAYSSTSDQLSALLAGECDWSVAKVSDVIPLLADSTGGTDAADAAAAEEDAPTAVPAPTQNSVSDAADAATPESAAGEHVRVLAIMDTERHEELPDVPTTKELGCPTGWYGSTRAIAAPAGTDPLIVDYYAALFETVMSDPACVAAHEEAGLSLYYLDPTALARRIDERERFNNSLLPKLFR